MRDLAFSAWRWLWWDRLWCGFCYGAGRMLGDSRRESMRVARKCLHDARHRQDVRTLPRVTQGVLNLSPEGADE